MNSNKIIRTICLFSNNPNTNDPEKLNEISSILAEKNFLIQTKRICSGTKKIKGLRNIFPDESLMLSVGTLSFEEAKNQLTDFFSVKSVNFNIDLTDADISEWEINLLFEIIKNNPSKTFDFTYVFNVPFSSPYFPSANYEKNGFSIGLQPTDLSEGCNSLEKWLVKIKEVWIEIYELFKSDPEFLGIDSSIAPLFEGKSSLVEFIRRLGMSFSQSATTDTYLKITKFIKEENPKPVGLCGLMVPCLEDFKLAEEYEKGEFLIERNIFLSLHSGLGIDVYPIGIDESKQKIIDVLRLVKGLSNKYKKPLSARFVSDGKAKIGEKTNFKNQYLKDVVLRKL